LRTPAAQYGNGRLETGIPRVAMVQGAIPEHELATMYEPIINMILQGCLDAHAGLDGPSGRYRRAGTRRRDFKSAPARRDAGG